MCLRLALCDADLRIWGLYICNAQQRSPTVRLRVELREEGEKMSPGATIASLSGSKTDEFSSLPGRNKIWLLAIHQSIFKNTDGSILKNRAFSVWKGLKKTHNSLATKNVLCFSASSHFIKLDVIFLKCCSSYYRTMSVFLIGGTEMEKTAVSSTVHVALLLN